MTQRDPKEAIEAFRKKVEGNVGLVMKHLAFNLQNRIVQKNPVDTGRSRAGWNMAVNHAKGSDPGPAPKGTKLAAPPTPVLGQINPGDKIYIANNVPYIGALEKGHSSQAPQGMVQQSINEVVTFYDGIVKQVR
jgi:hypothetical protein